MYMTDINICVNFYDICPIHYTHNFLQKNKKEYGKIDGRKVASSSGGL
jgi:hypothetical protein